jgi:hypothetical protein
MNDFQRTLDPNERVWSTIIGCAVIVLVSTLCFSCGFTQVRLNKVVNNCTGVVITTALYAECQDAGVEKK